MPVPPTRVAYDITKYLYVDDGLNETEQTYKLVYNTTGNLNYYYAYACSIYAHDGVHVRDNIHAHDDDHAPAHAGSPAGYRAAPWRPKSARR